jgi:hypothetical protein
MLGPSTVHISLAVLLVNCLNWQQRFTGKSKAFFFGLQCTLKSVEDFTEFEQRGAYFDTV